MPTLFLIVFIDLVGFGIIIPLLPFYAEHFAAEPDVVTALMAAYSVTQFVSAPLWGRLSDRVGRRPVLLASLVGAVVSYCWLGFAESLWMLFAARALGGAMAGNIAAAFAYVADVTAPAERAKGMGLVGAAFGLGFIFGPAIGGILGGADPAGADFRTPAFAAAGLSLLAFTLTAAMLRESLPAEARAGAPRRRGMRFLDIVARPQVGLAMALSFLATFVFAGTETTMAMWSERQFGWGPLQNGYLFAFLGFIAAAIQGGLMGTLVKRFGEVGLVVQGAVAGAAGLALITLSGSLPVLLVAVTSLTYGFSVMTPSLNSIISRRVGAADQGAVLGMARSATTLARALGPLWAGFLFAAFGRHWPYYGGALLMIAVLALSLRLWRPDHGEVNRD